MTIIPERALRWVERWGALDGSIGNDEAGNLKLTTPQTTVEAELMIDEIRSDPILAHGVGLFLLAALQNVPEDFE